MNNGTNEGNNAEIDFIKSFNSDKQNKYFEYYKNKLEITNLANHYMVRVTTKQYSRLSNQKVMTRADAYLIESFDNAIISLLKSNDYYIDEDILKQNKIEFKFINYSGISIKISDSTRFQILKLTPESFYTLFGEYELGASASIYCLREEEIGKNEKVLDGWHTNKNNLINRYGNEIPNLSIINSENNLAEKVIVYTKLKEFANNRIKQIIDNDYKLKEIIFNGYHIYEEPYTATFFYKGSTIFELNYIPFSITTGSGRSHGIFTVVLKPKNETNY